MGIRKMVEEQMVVPGGRDEWLGLCQQALISQKFKKVSLNSTLNQVRGDFKQIIGTLWGDIVVTLTPEGPNVRLTVRATANVDNVYALGSSPGGKLIAKFKAGLGPVKMPLVAPQEGHPIPITEQLERLAVMRGAGSLTDAEFQQAKSQLLG
ncbi:MAG: SHOCT domain-containing protein [Phycicoccus sp.]|nr:SHOCT domain-containing protein [Phycicoccus sp.]